MQMPSGFQRSHLHPNHSCPVLLTLVQRNSNGGCGTPLTLQQGRCRRKVWFNHPASAFLELKVGLEPKNQGANLKDDSADRSWNKVSQNAVHTLECFVGSLKVFFTKVGIWDG
jgi:hypothetical protein